MTARQKLEVQIRKASTKLAALHAELRELRAARELDCGCGERHAIKDVALLIEQYYHEPYGCTGGDYCTDSDYWFACPADPNTRTRLYFNDFDLSYEERTARKGAEDAFKVMYRSLFKGSEKWFDVDNPPRGTPEVHKYHLDMNSDETRDYFELNRRRVHK